MNKANNAGRRAHQRETQRSMYPSNTGTTAILERRRASEHPQNY
jgi:hypothetical protein